MNKEEILAKSRSEKKDEGIEFAFDIGRKSGVIGMIVIFSILAVFNLYNNRQETNYAIVSMFFGYLGCESYGIYRITRKKLELLKSVVGSIICIAFLYIYILS